MNGEVEVKPLAGTVEHLSARCEQHQRLNLQPANGILDLIIIRAHLSIVKPLLQVNLVPLFRMDRAKILNAYT